MGKAYNTLLLLLLSLLSFSGCYEIDYIIVPISVATEELNTTSENIDIPLDGFPDAHLQFRGTKLVVEKKF